QLTEDLFILRIRPLEGDVKPFLSGQYCVVGLSPEAPRCKQAVPEEKASDPDKLIRRAYSISSKEQGGDWLELYIALVKHGALTPRLDALERGDKLWLGPKITGHFTATPDDLQGCKYLILVATGTGLAPYISMLRSGILNRFEGKVCVMHGVRNARDLGYRSELELLQVSNPNFLYLPTLSRTYDELVPWSGEAGHVQEHWKAKKIHAAWNADMSPANTHFFLCGNPAMIQAMTETLVEEGYTEHSKTNPGQIHVEKYW
ncbi:MAG: ferredoxin--NADP reductase, partial [Candidatus Omnitrophica bacterium]|nr:ferredoxin--NADP reductase [Candidatus Omnitrophota bacterium]